MISLEDCIAMSGLTEAEVLAIAEHEGIPEIAAAAYGNYVLQHAHGAESVAAMIVDDIRAAQGRHDKAHVQTLLHVLHHFIRNHPESAPTMHPWSSAL